MDHDWQGAWFKKGFYSRVKLREVASSTRFKNFQYFRMS